MGLGLDFLKQNKEENENNNSYNLGMRVEGTLKKHPGFEGLFFFFALNNQHLSVLPHYSSVLISNAYIRIFLDKVK